MNKKSLLLSFIFIFTCFNIFSKAAVDNNFFNDYVGKQWTTEDGLPGMTIVTAMQDNKGYIYLGTYDGLVRFDGVEFQIFSRAVDKKYQFATAHAIFQDSNGNLWVGHNDEGLTCIFSDGNIKKYTVDDGLINNKINAITEDKDKNIWIGTAVGVCYLTPDCKIVVPKMDFTDEEKIPIVDMYCDTAGRIWITTGTKLFIYENETLREFEGFKSCEYKDIYYVTQDNSGAFWFTIAPHYAVRIKNGEETVFDIGHKHKDGSVVSDICQDSYGYYWFGTDSGITVLHDGVFSYLDTTNGLPEDGVNKIIEDDEGNIWVGLNRGGLYKLSRAKFQTISTGITINAICEDKYRDLIWIASDNGILCYKDNQFIENDLTRATEGLRTRHVGMTDENELLVSEFSFDKTHLILYPDGSIKTWSIEDGLIGNRNRVSIKAKSGDVYVGMAQGLAIIRPDGSVYPISKNITMENTYIMWLYEDSKNQIWVGTNGGGIYVLKDEKIVKHYTTADGLAGNVIFKIKEDNGIMWIGTGTGLSRMNIEDETFVNFNSQNGLGTDSVFQIFTDYTGTVWMLSNKGIISTKMSEMQEIVDGKRQKLTVHNYGKSDGLSTGGVTSTSCSLMDSKGRIWFTLVDGFAIYDPIKSEHNQRAPRIEIQEYSIDNEHFNYYGGKIEVPASAKRLRIKYTGLTSISPERVLFSYKLSGFENDFSDWENARSVSYTNMKAGNYGFSVMALNNDGIASQPCPPVEIVKLSHIWQHVWFWLVIIIMIAFIVFASVRYKLYKMRRYQLELEKKVDERTYELKLANEKSEKLLLNILPSEVAKELTDHPDRTIAKKYPNVAVLFTDIVNFTKMSDGLSAEEVVTMLNTMVSKFDERAKREGVEKIKTIGDAYMAACGLSDEDNPETTAQMVRFAKGLLEDVATFNANSPVQVSIRIGINTGNLVAGVIGKSKFIYDIWGDTVNVASRMESTGKSMKIHVTEETYEQTKDLFEYSEGVEVEVKGKGKMKTYYLG
ncbi:MAG: hypothetical protein K5829_07675 [Treponema sp.]|nr:hypothetical protein [Treponema sp.]